MSTAHPHVHVVGIDQAAQMPDKLPANVEFQLHDVNQGLKPYYGGFDIVHCRFIGGGITSYRAMIQEASKCVKPGGLAIFIEGNFDLCREDRQTTQEPASDANPDGSWMQRWLQGTPPTPIHCYALSHP
jgi:2-polyprenyl-3-methyl-5-hydroxy-6-metoxy-1,4-benzoquinol methylase